MSVSQSQFVEQAAGQVAHSPTVRGSTAGRGRAVSSSQLRWPTALGFLATIAITALYLSVVALAESWAHAWDLLRQDAPFVVPIVLGFGVQVGLFTHLKRVLQPANGTGATGAVTGTSGGVSTLGMLACCAHHLTDVLPLVGLSGAAVFVAQYKVPFMLIGLLSNAIGIGVLVTKIQRTKRMVLSEGACH